MRPIEASAEAALPPGDVWDFMWGDGGPPRFLTDMHDLGYWRDVTKVEDYEMRADGMPRYRMTRKFGRLPAGSMATEYDEFERPRRAVNHTLNTPLRGNFIATYEPTGQGTRITWRWEVASPNRVINRLLPVLRPFLVHSLQRNLDQFARAATQRRK
jgi:Polyketide cyclase / dehydrase and lipid transport